jgi:hypothetical protein
MASALDRLQGWYLSQCDSEWEHDNGVVVESLDNPGWQIRVDLAGTRWAGRPFDVQQHDRGEHDWLRCWVDATQWHAAAGPCNLEEAVNVFLEWVGADDSPAPRGDAVEDWLRQRWMERQSLASQASEESEE